jgi:hypothetical protein
MSKEVNEKGKLQKENLLQKEDNRLSYGQPKLRKHGKVSDATMTIIPQPNSDLAGGFPLSDLS